ncbi:MAG: hypothetical protein M3506_00745 [Chloroflexota bacterium]|nr:hypothetical protein [Chloroflexota bacterium]
MENYLTRLVERTLGLAEVALPVIPPMFAPDTTVAIDASMRDDPLQPVALFEDQPTQEAKGRTTPSSRPVPSSKPGSDEADGVAPPVPAAQHERSASIVGESPPVSEAFGAPALPGRVRLPALETSRQEPPVAPASSVEPGVSPTAFAEKVSPAIPAATRAVAAPVVRLAAVPVTDSAPTHVDRSAPPAGPTDWSAPVRATKSTVADRATAPEDGASRLTASRPPARPALENERSSAPVVRITVGRIEVRALQPVAAPPARRSPAPAPGLSLDAYLRAQHGGRS